MINTIFIFTSGIQLVKHFYYTRCMQLTFLLLWKLPGLLLRQCPHHAGGQFDENVGAFRKHSSNQTNVKTMAFRFRVDRKHFESEAFRKR